MWEGQRFNPFFIQKIKEKCFLDPCPRLSQLLRKDDKGGCQKLLRGPPPLAYFAKKE